MCRATTHLRGVVAGVEDVRRSAVMAGIVPDRRHLDNGGYHCCWRHLIAYGNRGDYSSTRVLDRPPKMTKAGEDCSCAYDIGMARADMIRTHAAVKRVHSDKTDPRRKYVNAINCWAGSGDAKRYNFQTGTVTRATPDHKTHVHGDMPRAYVDGPEAAKAARAHRSILTGESRAAWTAREEPKAAIKPTPKPTPTTWAIKPGDTLGKISTATGVSVANLQAFNRMGTSTLIIAGRSLRLTAPPTAVPAWPAGAGDFYRPRDNPKRYSTVLKWQRAMKTHGWRIDDDGYLGRKSEVVLVAFQRAEGLRVTRVLDKATFTRAFTTKRRGK